MPSPGPFVLCMKTCIYCSEDLSPPYAKYGDHYLCAFCSSQIEHQRMVTLGTYSLRVEEIKHGEFILTNQIRSLQFHSIRFFYYWKNIYGHIVKLVSIWFRDDIGYLWHVKSVPCAKLPKFCTVARYHRKVLGCMTSNKSIKHEPQPGDYVVFQLEGSKRKIPGVVESFNNRLRMYAVKPKSGRTFLAQEKYLTKIDEPEKRHFPDASVYINGELAWEGTTHLRESLAIRMAAEYDPRLRGLAQRYQRPKIGREYEWDGMIVKIKRSWKPRDRRTDTSEVNVYGTPIRIN